MNFSLFASCKIYLSQCFTIQFLLKGSKNLNSAGVMRLEIQKKEFQNPMRVGKTKFWRLTFLQSIRNKKLEKALQLIIKFYVLI